MFSKVFLHQDFPNENNQHERSELQSFCERSSHEKRSDAGEHHLEESKDQSWDLWSKSEAVLLHIYEECVFKTSYHSSRSLSIHKREAKEIPLQKN